MKVLTQRINAKGILSIIIAATEYIKDGYEPRQAWTDYRTGVITLVLQRAE